MKATSKDLKVKRAKRHTLCVRGTINYICTGKSGKKKNKTVQLVNSAESLPNGPMLLELAELQLAFPKLEFFRGGVPETESNKQDSI